MSENKKSMVQWPKSFRYIEKTTTEELHHSAVQQLIDKAIASTVPFMILEEGDTIVIKADKNIIVSRAYFIHEEEEQGNIVGDINTQIN